MATVGYVPGQRWISNTESELGLGVVSRCDGRRVVVSFPAAQEQRTYATDNAPLTRVIYPVGETVNTVAGETVTITARTDERGVVHYRATDDSGGERSFDELELDSFARFSRPQDRLLAGQLDPNEHFALRVETLEHRQRLDRSAATGLLGPRVALLPHQLYIATEVAARHAPRVLLADEVGLGKTIEAGLVVHQMLLGARASRVLFVVPDSLVHQWLVEMLRRFNLRLTILDEARCAAVEEAAGDNPFDSAQLVLCPLSTLSGASRRVPQAAASGWDLLVVDEAHHLEWVDGESSPAYRAVEAVAGHTPGLLLLTATPEQRGAEGHFARLRLLDPDRYPDPARFREEEQGYEAVSNLVGELTAAGILPGTGDDPERVARLEVRVREILGDAIAGELRAGFDAGDPASAVDKAIHALLDRHGTGRVLFRNTREAVGGFPSRKLLPHPLPAVDEAALTQESDPLIAMLDPVRAMGDGWLRVDPRVTWLANFLREHADERTLVICARADTARTLEEHLRVRVGLRTAVFHEDSGLLVRDRAAAWFAEPGNDGAQALICSEIGSEGRNFQHASRLVLFDLPLDPELLEQRIGRLDRIGQRHEVQIHVPHVPGGADAVLLRWYHEGLDAFERPCAIGERMREQFAGRLGACLAAPGDAAALDALVRDSREAARELLGILEKGRDRLLELGSCDPQRAAQLVQAVASASRATELAGFMDRVFDLFGVEHQADGAHSIVIHPGDHMLCHDFPGLPEDGASATFDRTQALAREDLEFLTWEHPMVTGAIGLILDGEIGNVTLCTLKGLPLKPGTLVLEGIFVVHCPGPRSLGLNRYLPQAMVRSVVVSTGRDLSSVLGAQVLNRCASPVPEDTARELLRHAWPQVESLIGKAQEAVDGVRDELVADAVARAAQLHGDELERLRALAAVNPNIRAEEVTHLEQRARDVAQHLGGATLQLDAIRIGLCT